MTEHDNHLEDMAGVNENYEPAKFIKITITIGDSSITRLVTIDKENTLEVTAEIVGDHAQSMAESFLAKFTN